MFDFVIKNARVVDGSGNPWLNADIGVKDGRIAELGRVDGPSDELVDARGKIACPGFIDIHTHTDFTVVVNGRAESMVMQGVTSVVIANCGHACYPVTEERKKELEETIFCFDRSIGLSWSDLRGYCRKLEEQGVALNVMPLLGLSSIRIAVMGFNPDAPSDSELASMKRYVEDGMRQGAFGVSSGLEYPPGSYASRDELVELCKVASRFSGFYSSHLRNRAEGFLQSTREAIEISREANIACQISHHVPRFPAEEKGLEGLALIDKARKDGLDVTCDTFPMVQMKTLERYAWGSTMLAALLPSWAFQKGPAELKKMLADKRIWRRMKRSDRPQARLAVARKWHRIMLEYSEKSPEYVGKTFDVIARQMRKDPWDAVFDILQKEETINSALMAYAAYGMKSGKAVMQHPTSSVISDGFALSPSGRLAEVRFQVIQSYGYVPLLFEKFVRQEGLLTLEEAVRKCTSLPASRLRLKDRGLIREGAWADIVVFDPQGIKCKATLSNPTQFPEGIEFVLVNGRVAVRESKQTDELSGRPVLAAR